MINELFPTIGKLICWWTGKHKRGKLFEATELERIFRCPRCGAETRYKVRPK